MKRTAISKVFVPAPIDIVFDTFTKHETYRELVGVRGTKLIESGSPEASNGICAVREIDLGIGKMTEKVTAFNRPTHWDYLFIKWPLPYVHTGGRMSFQSVPGGTVVVWESSVDGNVSLIKRTALPLFAWLGSGSLKLLALQMKRIAVRNAKALQVRNSLPGNSA